MSKFASWMGRNFRISSGGTGQLNQVSQVGQINRWNFMKWGETAVEIQQNSDRICLMSTTNVTKISRIWRSSFKTTRSKTKQHVAARRLLRNKAETHSGCATAAQWQPNNLLKSSSGEFPELVVSTETFLVTRSLYRNKQVVRAGNSCDRRGPWQRVTDLELKVKNYKLFQLESFNTPPGTLEHSVWY